MFCYTGGFSVYAMRGGAALVHSVDSSAKAMDLTRENIALNFPGDTRHEGFAEDAFRFLGHIRPDDTYDLIVLDPPAFAKHKDAVRNAIKGYTRLNAIAFEKLLRAACSSLSAVRKPSAKSNSDWPSSPLPLKADDECVSSINSTSRPTTPSTSTTPRVNISRASC